MDLGYDSIEASRIENEKKELLYSQLITIELKHELLEMKGKEKEKDMLPYDTTALTATAHIHPLAYICV